MLSSHKNDIQSFAFDVTKLDNAGLTLVDQRVKINEICYCGLLLPQQVLRVMSGLWRVQK